MLIFDLPKRKTTRRVSLRARGLAPDGTEAEKIKKEAELVAAQTRKRHSGTESFAGTLYEPDDYQDFDGDSDDSKRQNLVDSFAMKIRSSSGGVDERFSVGEDKKTGADRILDMKIIGEEPQRKVLVSRVYSINIHPRKDRILVGAGKHFTKNSTPTTWKRKISYTILYYSKQVTPKAFSDLCI